ncbi:MAG: ankyrin repeat domain-containing protein [Treponema sp.]|nr:ankyrin repeat domain-containing protein [Treponema sp.]
MMKKIFLFALLIILISCSKKEKALNRFRADYVNESSNEEREMTKAIVYGKTKKIEKIIENDDSIILRSYNENYSSYLHLAVHIENIKSVETLLKLGFNPNVKDKIGGTPLYYASGHSIYPYEEDDKLTKILYLLLDYGAEPNQHIGEQENTPLMNLVGQQVFKENYLTRAKLLVEKGKADVNLKNKYDATASDLALLDSVSCLGMNHITRFYAFNEAIKTAHYLIVTCHSDVKSGFYYNRSKEDIVLIYPVQLLRRLTYPLDSDEYKLKMEIVEEFARQGVDYKSEPIPDPIVQFAKMFYPEDWEEYLVVY